MDSAATAELIWDEFVPRSVRAAVDEACDGRGRELYVALCGLHDIGKATPAFQSKVPELAKAGQAAGLTWTLRDLLDANRWHHTIAGAAIVEGLSQPVNSHSLAAVLPWFASLVSGHHGLLKGRWGRLKARSHGNASWVAAQRVLVDLVLDRLGSDRSILSLPAPHPQLQLSLLGYVTMADWIASSDEFPGLGLRDVELPEARERARRAWGHLGLRIGWSHDGLGQADFVARFGYPPAPLQELMPEVVGAMQGAGLLIIEAPMGEGKTEAALFATEYLAAREGCGGFVFAMPTQGTTDAMYQRVTEWAQQAAPGLPVSLLHGKAMLNEEWVTRLNGQDGDEFSDIFGDDDPYGVDSTPASRGAAPSQWLLGRHRTLLAPGVVGTVDQILWAATRTKFVALRHAGLAGKVVIIDEVHSFDVHMSQFVHELLRWCGDGGIPVILMSATLPDATRADLVSAYLGRKPELLTSDDSYPRLTLAGPETSTVPCVSRLRPSTVGVEILGCEDPEDLGAIAACVADEVADGGVALVILNTVARAQGVYRLLRDKGVQVELIHGRLTTAERARRTHAAVQSLGPKAPRPARLVIVATQIAEQSFDVDADVLVSDIAPIDLLLQRVGRVHRHNRPGEDRPARLRNPRVIVTGVRLEEGEVPRWVPAFDAVYGQTPVADKGFTRSHALLACCDILMRQSRHWQLPADIPRLVSFGYSGTWRDGCQWREEAQQAWLDLLADAERRRARAQSFTLAGPESGLWATGDISDLHARPVDAQAPVVRDGDPTHEVCLIVRSEGSFRLMDGTPLGRTAARATDPEVARRVLGDTVRMRDDMDLGALLAPSGWNGSHLLENRPTLILDDQHQAKTPAGLVRYDPEEGLSIDRSMR